MAQKVGRSLLVCSLGNPGTRYQNTRHSVGHLILDKLIEDNRTSLNAVEVPEIKGELLLGRSKQFNGGESNSVLGLYKPRAYMNESGRPVFQMWKLFRQKIYNSQLVLIHDDLSLKVGQVKVEIGGPTRGHNGLKSVYQYIEPQKITKIRVGISRPESRNPYEVAEYVLAKFPPDELSVIQEDSYPIIWNILASIEGRRLEL
ncbi:peptidyl-tRNA hydrolase [Lipomyces oligophaga]|uniref:peptidyl-tRNA hydrolase n=1 Tax=Lipomyces oligophaga TaxID=45792 RepID=UPI0034CFF8DE